MDRFCVGRSAPGARRFHPMGRVRVVIVDDHRMVADGLAAVLDADPRIEVVGRASTADAAAPADLSRLPE